MIYIRRPTALFGKTRLKLAAISILAGLMLIPAKAEDSLGEEGASSVRAMANAKIHKRFELSSEKFVDRERLIDQRIPDISLRDCDTKQEIAFKKCVLMIYEIQ